MKILREQRIVLTPTQMANRTVRARPDTPRSAGVHVAAIVKHLGVAAGKLSSDDESPFEKFSEQVYPLMPALGVAWEELRASTYGENQLLWQPCEFERDGIYGTPDGIWYDAPHAGIWECKLTTKRLCPISEHWTYLKQTLCYCAMGGYEFVLFDVLYLLGDYSRPYQPIGVQTLVEFSEQEIEGWWSVVRAAASKVKAEEGS